MALRVSLHFFPVWFTVHHSNGNSGMVQSKLQCAVLELCTIMLFSYQIDFEMSGQARGNMTFGIIQGREIIDGANGELLQDATFYTCKLIKCFDHDGINFLVIVERFNNAINLSSLYILLLCLLLTIPLSLVNLCVEFINTYQVVKEWWKGPPSIYVISLAIGEIILYSHNQFSFYFFSYFSISFCCSIQ